MNSFFMIEFKYLGESYFANVFEYGPSRCLYDIQLINIYPADGSKITLRRTEDGFELPDHSGPVHQEFIKLIINKIEERLANSCKH
jgi:hypothetical protein